MRQLTSTGTALFVLIILQAVIAAQIAIVIIALLFMRKNKTPAAL